MESSDFLGVVVMLPGFGLVVVVPPGFSLGKYRCGCVRSIF